MPTPAKGARLGGGPAHERLMLANLATQLFEHQSITTTLARAKRLRPYAERLISFAKRGDLASRRRVMRVVRDATVVHELFTEIGPAMAERDGGYTRITKIGPRKGDAAPMAVIQLVMEPVKPKKKRSAKPGAAESGLAAQAEAKAEEVLHQTTDDVGDQADDAESLREKAEAAAIAGALAEAEADGKATAEVAADEAAEAAEKAESKDD